MALIIEITEGIQKGEKFKIFPEATIGRRKTDIVIKDPNVSSLHAKIEIVENSIPVIVDQNSKNGLILNQQVVRKIPLFPDITFIIGDTPFKVSQVTERELDRLFPTKTWQEKLNDYIDANQPLTHAPEELTAFNPKMELHFTHGLQCDEVFLVGYGPRLAGYYSLDIPLHDESCPEQAFKLIPSPEGAKILNCSLDKVFLNDAIFESSILASGDKIKIGNTLIMVLFTTG